MNQVGNTEKKAVFFDIDGTIWDRNMTIPDSTRDAIRLLQENGVYTFICTGRTPAFIQIPELLNLGFDGILAGCGTYVSFQGKELLCETIAPERMKMTLEILKKHHMPVVLEGKTYEYVEEEEFANDPFLTVLKQSIGENLLSITGNEMKWEASKFSASIKGVEYKEALEELEEWYDFLVHDNVVVEGVPKGFSKASGIQTVCEKLGIEHKNTYAFGDSINDVEMLKYVAHGIAMGNGTADAKLVADYVTDSIHENGIYNACKHFGLI